MPKLFKARPPQTFLSSAPVFCQVSKKNEFTSYTNQFFFIPKENGESEWVAVMVTVAVVLAGALAKLKCHSVMGNI